MSGLAVPRSDLRLEELVAALGAEKGAFAYLEELRWRDGAVCPRCGSGRTGYLEARGVMLAGWLDRDTTVAPATRRRALLATLQAFIDSHLADPELSPSTIAAAHHISLRYLHRLFEGQGTTVGKRIKNRRLASCRQDLLDPSLAALPVNAIASRWGFIDAARFSRAFRDAYGQPPGEFRRHLASAAAITSQCGRRRQTRSAASASS
jgi:AraC-like DNA-binding protein